nr:basic proline-rich protein-like [Loxodonta africana]
MRTLAWSSLRDGDPGADSGPGRPPIGVGGSNSGSPPGRHHLRPLRRRLCPALHCRVGPSGPTSPGPRAPEERRRSRQGRTRPGREHGVPLSLGGCLTTSIPPPRLGLGRRPARSPPGLPRPTLRFSNRSPSVFGASFLPARSGPGYTTPRPGAAPVPCPPSSNNLPAPSAGGRPPPERAIPRRRPRPRPLASGSAMGEGASERRGPRRPHTRRRAGSAAAGKRPASSRPPRPGTPAPPPPSRAATLQPPPPQPPACKAGGPRGLSPRGAPSSPMAGPWRRTRGREAERASG